MPTIRIDGRSRSDVASDTSQECARLSIRDSYEETFVCFATYPSKQPQLRQYSSSIVLTLREKGLVDLNYLPWSANKLI